MLKVYNVAKVLRLLQGRKFGSLCLYLALKKNLLQFLCGSVQSSRVKLAWLYCYCSFFLTYGLSEHRQGKNYYIGLFPQFSRGLYQTHAICIGFSFWKNLISIYQCLSFHNLIFLLLCSDCFHPQTVLYMFYYSFFI